MSVNCDPAVLVNQARCFARCIPDGELSSVKSYLLCQIASNGISGGGGDTPAGFTFDIFQLVAGLASAYSVAGWTVPPAGAISTELWTSTDNVTFVLSATVAAPGNSAIVESGSSPFYGKIRFVTGSGNGPFTSVLNINYGTDFSARVVANLGGAPPALTRNAVNTWCDSMARAGLLKKIYSAICPVDSIPGSLTPMVGHLGFSLWINHAFVVGDLTVVGLLGNGATKYAETGVNVSTISATLDPLGVAYPSPIDSFGLDFYDTASSNSTTCEIGAHGAATPGPVYFLAQFLGSTIFADPEDGVGGATTFVTVVGERLAMGNRIASNVAEMYDYVGGAFIVRATNASNVAGDPLTPAPLYAWASNRAAGLLFSDKRGSYACIRRGMTRVEAQAYAPIVRTLRTSLGGGDP